MDITMTEWKQTEDKIAAEVARRWPWLVRSSPHHAKMRVETPMLTAGAELLWSGDDRSGAVRVAVHSSTCLSGGAADIAEAARQIAEVRDAMLYIHGTTRDLVIWPDGECPCAYCGGTGLTRGGPCIKCGGKGKV